MERENLETKLYIIRKFEHRLVLGRLYGFIDFSWLFLSENRRYEQKSTTHCLI